MENQVSLSFLFILNERSVLESVQVYWKYCSKYASILDTLSILSQMDQYRKVKVTRVVNTLWLPCLRQGISIPDACTLMAAFS